MIQAGMIQAGLIKYKYEMPVLRSKYTCNK